MTTPVPIEGQMSFDDLLGSADRPRRRRRSTPPSAGQGRAPEPTPIPDATPTAATDARRANSTGTDGTGTDGTGTEDTVVEDTAVEDTASEAEVAAESCAERAPSEATIVLEPLTVEVIRSSRRQKTAQARLLGSTLEVRIPDRCTDGEEQEFIAHFRSTFERRRSAEAIDLTERATELARRHFLPIPTSIRWVDNQSRRWGSCTPADGTIRLSSRMATFPRWVVDYVIVHELAHLRIADHSPAFWELVSAYPLSERARGYLMAKSEHPDD